MGQVTISEFVTDFFKNQPLGRFLEIGANDGCPNDPLEPCWNLLTKGWTGCYIEPSPIGCNKLITNLIDHKLIQKADIYNFAIGEETGISKLYISRLYPSISSLSEGWADHLKQHSNFFNSCNDFLKTEVYVHTTSLPNFFQTAGYDFDFISIDIELHAYELDRYVTQVNFDLFHNLKLICIEMWDEKYIVPHLSKFGYKKVLFDSETTTMFFAKI